MKHRRTAVLTLFSMLIVGIRVFAQTITINEVMADPAGADYYDEFIELYNCGESALTLKGYYLEINGYVDTLDFLADYGDSIPACGFALILDRGYLVENKSSTYEDLIPDEPLLVTIQDNSLARTGLVNSEANLIYLFNSQADTISAVLTTTKPLSGYSWEKINPESDNSVANWGNSRYLRGTPGFWNSIAPRDQDVAISGLKVVTPGNQIVPNQPIELRFAIKNVGLKIASSVQARCGLDCDADRQIDEIFLDEIITIPAGDSVLKYVTTPGFSPGSQIILAEAIFTADERPENNRDSLVVKIPYTENCLIINEFMYYPATDGGGEWVELFNVSSDTINLKEWTLSDNSSTVQLTGQDFYLPPQNYVVIVNDSTSFISYWGRIQNLLDCPQTMPAFNNTRDSIVIRGHCGHMIDALEYSSAWGYRQGTSLERKNPYASGNQADNWALSTGEEKATPGCENSIALRDFDLAIDSVKVKVNDLPPPPNSSVAALIYICNSGKQPVTAFELEMIISNPLFGTIADTTLTIISALSTGQTQVVEIVFTNVPGGLHDITVEIFHSADEISNNNLAVCKLPVGYPTGALVINEIMYAPLSGQCEWFEIYNNSTITIDLNNWKFRDALGKQIVLADSGIAITGGEYVVVAARSDFAMDYPDFRQKLIVPVSFPTLNNTTDSLFLYDAADRIVDGVCYSNSWGGGAGISLERLDPAQPALSADNWSSSLNASTPGQFNSVAKLDDDLAILPASFQFADTLDEVGLKADFSLTIKNVGRNLSGYFIVNIYFDHNRYDSGRADELCWSKTVSEPLAPDSTILITGQIRAEKAGRNVYLAEIEFRADENPADNHASADLLVGYPAGCLTINEFLAYPVSDQVEFIEFINVTNAPVDLSEWILGNHLSEATTTQVEIAAGGYVVFSGDSACFNFFKPSGAQVIVPRKWPGLNNSSDRIWLKDLTGKTIDSLYYTVDWSLKAGYSTEKILPERTSADSESWALAVNPECQTAGYLNSVTQPENDLSLDSLRLSSVSGDTSTVFSGRYFIANKGRNQACQASLVISIESSPTEAEMHISLNCLETGRVDSGTFQIGPLFSGTYILTARILWEEDRVAANDTVSQIVKIAWPEGRLLLSEFMPYPLDVQTTNNSVAEYLEFFNPGECEIDVTGWMISDQNTAIRRSIPAGYLLPAGAYFAIAGDSSAMSFPGLPTDRILITSQFPSLNNSEDALYLYDPTGKAIDSLFYNATWNITKGIAMERISFENPNQALNWRTSVDPAGGTPGQPNSVALHQSLKKAGIKPAKEIFSPNGDGIDDEIGIEYLLPFPSARLTLEIFDLVGRLVYRPAKNLITAAKGVIYWNGASDYGGRARVGIYIIRCVANDLGSTKSVEYITTLVLAL